MVTMRSKDISLETQLCEESCVCALQYVFYISYVLDACVLAALRIRFGRAVFVEVCIECDDRKTARVVS